MKVISVYPDSFGGNTYLLISGGHALVVDPAVSAKAILSAAQREGVVLDGILLTHGHFDHIISVDTLRDAAPIGVAVHEEDAVMLVDGKKNAFFDFFGKERTYRPAERLLRDGDRIPLGDEAILVIHTPGHTMGSVCYLGGDSLISGDTLFADSYGRCDLFGGSMEEMCASLRRLRSLDGDLTLYPGHGASTRLSHALDNVAYLLDGDRSTPDFE